MEPQPSLATSAARVPRRWDWPPRCPVPAAPCPYWELLRTRVAEIVASVRRIGSTRRGPGVRDGRVRVSLARITKAPSNRFRENVVASSAG